ncbi:MAG: hypothetical protein QNK37_24450 [Acidobacteriota bacterium]|nr:hypothetical protein [Acidobacteriota bacterium]
MKPESNTLEISLQNSSRKNNKGLVLFEQSANSLQLSLENRGGPHHKAGFIPGEPIPLNPTRRPDHTVLHIIGLGDLLTPSELATLHIQGWKSAIFKGPLGYYMSLSPNFPFAVLPGRPVVQKGCLNINHGLSNTSASLSLVYQGISGMLDDTCSATALMQLHVPEWKTPYVLHFA